MNAVTALCIGLLAFAGILHTIWLWRIEKKISENKEQP